MIMRKGKVENANPGLGAMMVMSFWLVVFCVLAAPLRGESGQVRDLFSNEYDSMLYGVEKISAVGFSVVIGDVNGDGLDDVMTGAPFADGRFRKKIINAGATYVYFGWRDLQETVDLSTKADLIIYGAARNENSGFAIAAGDLNGDGIKDIIIGAPQADSKLSKKKQNDSGVTYVVFGRKEFPGHKIGLETGAADVELHSTKNREYTGSALAVGDYNGDGIDDLLIGGALADIPNKLRKLRGSYAGVAYIVYGSRNLSGKINLTRNAPATVRGLKAGDRLGMALAAGDLNADGLDDLVLGAPKMDVNQPPVWLGMGNVGTVSVIFGRKDLPAKLNLAEDAVFQFWGSYPFDEVGTVMCVGDVNGDKVDDLMIGVPDAGLRAGKLGEKDES